MTEYIPAKTIVSGAKGEHWFGIDYNMNIYKGCCHGCIYCDSRSDCYGIEDFDKVRVKENALETIRADLKSKRRSGVIGTGAMSDPYNPLERELYLTRGALKLADEFGFGIAIATKSSLMTRDLDILKNIASHSPVLCKVTVTAADDTLASIVEPRVCVSSERFRMIKALSDAGIFTGILMMPVLPFLEDTEENIGQIVKRAAESGARFIYPAIGMTLRQNQKEHYFSELNRLFPDRGLPGKYLQEYGNSYECRSTRSKELFELFAGECRKCGLLYKMEDIIEAYREPYEMRQMSLF